MYRNTGFVLESRLMTKFDESRVGKQLSKRYLATQVPNSNYSPETGYNVE